VAVAVAVVVVVEAACPDVVDCEVFVAVLVVKEDVF
jgi:hypothetical protein